MREQSTAVRLPNEYRVCETYAVVYLDHKSGERFQMYLDLDDLPSVLALPTRITPKLESSPNGRMVYAHAKIDGKQQRIHRWLLKPPAHLTIHHVNANGLDNRRCNLMALTQAEHNQYRRPGTYQAMQLILQHRLTGRWSSWVWLGEFPTETEARLIYDEAHARLTESGVWDSPYAARPAEEADRGSGVRDAAALYRWRDHAA